MISEPSRFVRLPTLAAALGAGALVAASLPPWGWWPLAFVGLAIHAYLIHGAGIRDRRRLTFVFAFAWFLPACLWMYQLTAPGYPIAVAIFSLYMAASVGWLGGGRWAVIAVPAALTLAEAVRFCFPFGGVPIATLPMGQVGGPLAPIARLGGPLLLTFVTCLTGSALALVTRRRWRPSSAALLAVVAVAGLARVAPDGSGFATAKLALVQGGGPQGTHAIDGDPEVVFQRHLAADQGVPTDVDLVVWPENVIVPDTPTFAESTARTAVTERARSLGVPYAVGVTERVDAEHFTNAQIVVLGDGSPASRYDKVRRVPFGEYMPFRSLLEALPVGAERVPRDAAPGTGPAVIDVPGIGRVGVVISWEVFFAGRARDAAVHGATVLLNPTNGASYTGSILQTQQVASSRLRAIETGRWVAQVAPTGFSAFVAPDGTVTQRSAQVEAAVLVADVELRRGRTLAVRIGDVPWVIVVGVVLAASNLTPGKRFRLRVRPLAVPGLARSAR